VIRRDTIGIDHGTENVSRSRRKTIARGCILRISARSAIDVKLCTEDQSSS